MLIQPIDFFLVAWFILAVLSTAYPEQFETGSG